MNNNTSIFKKIFSWPSLIALILGIGFFVGMHYVSSLAHFLILYYFGVVVVASLVGLIPSFLLIIIGVGFESFFNPSGLFFFPIHVLIACLIYIASKRRLLTNFKGTLIVAILVGLIAGFGDFLLSWLLDGAGAAAILSDAASPWWLNMLKVVGISLADAIISISITLLIYRFLPDSILAQTELGDRYFGHQNFFKRNKEIRSDLKDRVRIMPLAFKIMIVDVVTVIAVGAAVFGVSATLYKEESYNSFGELTKAYATTAEQLFDPEQIDSFIANGEADPNYQEMLDKVYHFYTTSSDNVEYVYVYQMIKKDGENYCRTIFDAEQVDNEEVQYGMEIAFDDYFQSLADTLFDENNLDVIGPLVGHDSYGWLMTIYQPLKNASGKKVAYLGIDVNMANVVRDIRYFDTKITSLLIGILLLLTGITYVAIDFLIIQKVVGLEEQTHNFSKVHPTEWLTSEEYKNRAVIRSGDELENLSNAVTSSQESICDDFKKIEEQTKALLKLEKNIIFVMANMVEERDKCTGDHIIKTQYYTGLIVTKLYNDHLYPEIVDEEYVKNLITAAPLHDVGKIKISDVILNKPGKLTDEEFELMKNHVVEGGKLIAQTLKDVTGNSYLNIAKDVATYHHERWDGRGYMNHLKGEEIPLAARIMAIADVFDALVSKRSYKEPFTYEKALEIMKEESGTHFDPYLMEVFLSDEIQDKVKEKLGIK